MLLGFPLKTFPNSVPLRLCGCPLRKFYSFILCVGQIFQSAQAFTIEETEAG